VATETDSFYKKRKWLELPVGRKLFQKSKKEGVPHDSSILLSSFSSFSTWLCFVGESSWYAKWSRLHFKINGGMGETNYSSRNPF